MSKERQLGFADFEQSMTKKRTTRGQFLSMMEKVAPIEETAARLFYGRLFEVNPELRPLFKSDMKEQGQKLMKMLAVAVDGLSRIEEIVPAVEDMGRRHAGYGVKDSHYGAVASALLRGVFQRAPKPAGTLSMIDTTLLPSPA